MIDTGDVTSLVTESVSLQYYITFCRGGSPLGITVMSVDCVLCGHADIMFCKGTYDEAVLHTHLEVLCRAQQFRDLHVILFLCHSTPVCVLPSVARLRCFNRQYARHALACMCCHACRPRGRLGGLHLPCTLHFVCFVTDTDEARIIH